MWRGALPVSVMVSFWLALVPVATGFAGEPNVIELGLKLTAGDPVTAVSVTLSAL